MFRSFEEKELYEAIDRKDLLWIRGAAMNTMWNDPIFETGEIERLMKILHDNDKKLQIFQDEVTLGYEYRLDSKEWTKGYFAELTYWFRENFAESRIDYIKEVGRAVYKAEFEKEKKKDSNKQEPLVRKSKENKDFPDTRTILVAVALVVVILLLLKALID